MTRMRTILCASDFSPASRPAFRKAVELARAAGARLVLVHVLAPLTPLMLEDSYLMSKTWNETAAAARAAAAKQLDALVRAARKAGVRAASLLVEGVAAEQLARTAKAQRADVLVLGTHGRTGLTKLFVGSVAARVVATAACPVLTVRGTSRRAGRRRP
jgi:nucleotide-binding universal stress UspA family protein